MLIFSTMAIGDGKESWPLRTGEGEGGVGGALPEPNMREKRGGRHLGSASRELIRSVPVDGLRRRGHLRARGAAAAFQCVRFDNKRSQEC